MKTAINLINLKERYANFKALSVLNLAQPRDASVNFMSLPDGGKILRNDAAQNSKKDAHEPA